MLDITTAYYGAEGGRQLPFRSEGLTRNLAVLRLGYLSSRLGQTMKATLLPRRVLKPAAFSHIGGVTPFLPIATNFAFGASGVITANTFWPAASIARSVGSNRTIGVPTGTKTLDVPPL